MDRLPGTLATAVIVASLLAVLPSPAHACSWIPPVSPEGIEAALLGEPLPDQDAWLLEHSRISGFVEYTVAHAWEATLDYEAASAEVPTRSWGTFDNRLVRTRVVGGEARGPFVRHSPCGPADASPAGTLRYTVMTDAGGSHPVDGVLKADLESLLTDAFGAPGEFEALEFDDRHPGYEREVYSWQSWLTWGRITWAVTAVLSIPILAFGSWLYSTRRD